MPTYDCRHGDDAQVTNWECSGCGEVRHGCEHVCERPLPTMTVSEDLPLSWFTAKAGHDRE